MCVSFSAQGGLDLERDTYVDPNSTLIFVDLVDTDLACVSARRKTVKPSLGVPEGNASDLVDLELVSL